jgi:hypothetical protein
MSERTSNAMLKRMAACGFKQPSERECCGNCGHSSATTYTYFLKCGLHTLNVKKRAICNDYITPDDLILKSLSK